jgi:branched-chain amino acid transport system permease protein
MNPLVKRALAVGGTVAVLLLLTLVLTPQNMARVPQGGVIFRVVMLSGIAIIMAVSLNLINGFTGQFSIGHAGFQAVGAYAAAALTVYGHKALFPFLPKVGPLQPGLAGLFQGAPAILLAMLVGGLVAALIGYVVGLPSLRLRGDYLAIVTLGFGEIIRVIIENTDALGGSRGFDGVFQPERVAIPRLTNFFWVYLVVVIVVVLSRNLRFSTYGLSFLAVREDEVAAQAMGVDTTAVKVKAFVLGSFFAGVAGALFAHYEFNISPTSFTFVRSFDFVTMLVLGGLGSITGSVVAAVILTALPEVLRSTLGSVSGLEQYRLVAYALLLIILMLVRPQGVFGRGELRIDSFFRRRPAATPLTQEGTGDDKTT